VEAATDCGRALGRLPPARLHHRAPPPPWRRRSHTSLSRARAWPLLPASPGHTGALYGTYEAFRLRIPGAYKIRHIGQATLGTGLAFGVFMAAGALVRG